MIVWSTLRPFLHNRTANAVTVLKRGMGGHHRVLPYQPSRWQWQKFKDYAHFYIALGVIPLTVLVTGVNVFIGPATLTEIPEDYEPKHWEYYRHPITRFLARYVISSPQQNYEKYLHHIFEEDEKAKLRKLERQVREKMAERNDYQAYYYRPVLAKYHRISREASDYIDSIRGD
ncbi:hypothetical protein ILUMI_21272 [Ignelater luminosus]|uniref:NADH dehydrogenase [ubiquinone] 1 beta subcomplex subunit 5, mitochondrial n=1 Tax=Ignelater luminosus TaxID=2038154 RepID=A0A8K0CFW7_IGNLU|nr:hypothetical protein ILUMI_21272 [Ignelater luminosus]